MSISTRDLQGRREFREFVQVEAERQRLAQDQEQYRVYCKTLEHEQANLPPALRIEPIPFEEWRSFADPDESDPILRGQVATYKALAQRAAVAEREAVTSGKPDPGFQLPSSAIGKSATLEQAKKINVAEFRRFKERNQELYFSAENMDRLTDYLSAQGVNIADAETYEAAWLRLQALGLLEDRPEAEPEPHPEPQIEADPVGQIDDGSMTGIDLETGQPRIYSKWEIDHMQADKYKRVFQLNAERRLAAWKEMFLKPSWY